MAVYPSNLLSPFAMPFVVPFVVGWLFPLVKPFVSGSQEGHIVGYISLSCKEVSDILQKSYCLRIIAISKGDET